MNSDGQFAGAAVERPRAAGAGARRCARGGDGGGAAEKIVCIQNLITPTDEPTKCYAQSALQVRLWSVPERRELALADVHEMATAAAWAPGGCRVAVGTLKGKVRFYAADDNGRLEYEAQIGAASHCTWSVAEKDQIL